jgi:integrase
MQEPSSHGPKTRERVAPNLYRRTTKGGGDVYEVSFRDVDGRQRLRRLDAQSERAAIRETRALLSGRDDGARVVAADLTVNELADREYWPMLDGLARAGRRSERGVALYKEHWRLYVESHFGALRLGEIEASDVSAWLRSMRDRGYSESTIYSGLLILRAVFRLAIRRGFVARAPFDRLDPAELPRPKRGGAGRVLTEVELAALVRQTSDYYRPIVTMLAFSGLRISEACALRWLDIDFVEGEFHVRGQLSRPRGNAPSKIVAPKTRSSLRTVPIWPAVEQMLVELLASEQRAGRGRDTDFVFCARNGSTLQQFNVADRGVEAAAKRAGIGHVSPHDLRRSFCALAARRGVDPAAAAELTGHSLAVWASSYARSFGKSQRDDARAKMLDHGFGAVVERDDENVSAVSADPSRTTSTSVDQAQGVSLSHAVSSSRDDC